MVMDGGAPRCLGCDQPLHFGTDRQGRTTESCACGYQGYLKTRTGCTRPAAWLDTPPGDGLLP